MDIEVEDYEEFQETVLRLRSRYEPKVEDSGVHLNDVQRLMQSITL
jgi:hypothetical protein